jgi:hypothetical protein
MPRDNYAEQMEEAAKRETAKTAAEGNCIARSNDGSLCRRPVPKELRQKGIQTCRAHIGQRLRYMA